MNKITKSYLVGVGIGAGWTGVYLREGFEKIFRHFGLISPETVQKVGDITDRLNQDIGMGVAEIVYGIIPAIVGYIYSKKNKGIFE